MKSNTSPRFERRHFLGAMAGLLAARRGLFAEALTQTPSMTIGPYYPDRLPLDLDNDLIRINDNLTSAIGTVSWMSGRVLGSNGLPLRNALVEIWQADNNGAYIHSASPSSNRDPGFQGYGRFETGSTGEYLFRTVKPGLYPGRARHVHVQVTAASGQKLISQLFIQGEALNSNDSVLTGVRDLTQRSSVVRPWTAVAGSPIGELAVNWDIVFGFTPPDSSVAKPVVLVRNGVLDGAGFQPGITPGAWLSIFGDDLSETSRSWDAATEIVNGSLPLSLDGVSVTINGTPAPVFYISPGQINVQAPSDLLPGPAQVIVKNSDGISDPVTASVQAVLPGFFLFPQNYVAAVRADGSYVSTDSPAKSGETISLFGTGFGPTSPEVQSGRVFQGAAPLVNKPQIRIGTVYAEVLFAGTSAAGLNQFNVVVPNLAAGDYDVRATVAGVRTQPLARLRIS